MKRILFTVACMALVFTANAKPIDQATANKTGLNFLLANTHRAFTSGQNLSLAYESTSNANGIGTVYYYVFNADHGFVMVAGDDRATPILGYSDEETFDAKNIPAHVTEWLNGYTQQMQYIIGNQVAATPEIQSKWNNLINNVSPDAPQQSNASGTPLLTTLWAQLPYYNDDCPYDNGASRHAVTGCVATAMAMVMKFWNYPATGTSFHSYNDPTYGTQSASFGATTYNWNAMPDQVNSANAAVATLMYQCGVSVNMTYGTSESDAYVLSSQSPEQNCAEYALKAYFGYDNGLKGISRSDYSDGNWLSAIEAEIDAGRPVIYTGTGSGGGHCFVCDGYSSNNYLHFNWGWGGEYDGYFQLNALNPGGVGTGGGSGAYNSNHQAIIGIQPSKALLSYDLALASNIVLSSTTVQYTSGFTAQVNVANINTNSHNFNGDFSAEIFDNTNTLVDSVGVVYGANLNLGASTGTMTLTYGGKASLLPGIYTVQVFYRPKGGDWAIVQNLGSYINLATLTVTKKNSLELFAPVAVTGTTQNGATEVSFNVYNDSNSTFTGLFYAYLYDLNGNPDFKLGESRDTLASQTSFANNISISNMNDTVSPGTYLLVLYYSPDFGAPFQLLGSTHYQNPVKITISAPPLPADPYEPDNTVDSAYTFVPNFVGDSAEISTLGANINTGSDLDFYKIKVQSGYYYSFSTWMYDTRYSADSQDYTLDGIVSYSTDSGNGWSPTYSDSIPGQIAVNGGGSIVYKIAPLFGGGTGTYRLVLKIQRHTGAGIVPNAFATSDLKIFPNPATDIINVDYVGTGIVRDMQLVDITGKTVLASDGQPGKTSSSFSVANIPTGIYVLQLQTDNGTINAKLSVIH